MPGAAEMPLPQLISGIREGVLAACNTVAGVKEVVYGERQRIGSFKMPCLWVVPESWQPALSGGHSAIHSVPYTVVAMVKGSDPQADLKAAEGFSNSAYDAIMADRSLGGLVSDVRPVQVDPGYEAGGGSRVCYAACRIECVIRRRE